LKRLYRFPESIVIRAVSSALLGTVPVKVIGRITVRQEESQILVSIITTKTIVGLVLEPLLGLLERRFVIRSSGCIRQIRDCRCQRVYVGFAQVVNVSRDSGLCRPGT